jgi:nucleotide-binding universal stress UspA family protein
MANRILIAIDGSENANRAIAYAGRLLRNAPECRVTLFHVLERLPPELLEHGGSENPRVLDRKEETLQPAQGTWVDSKREEAAPLLLRAREILKHAGIGAQQIETRLANASAHVPIAQRILQEAQQGGYHTIVVGRRGLSMVEKLLYGSVTEEILQKAEGVTLWVVQ